MSFIVVFASGATSQPRQPPSSRPLPSRPPNRGPDDPLPRRTSTSTTKPTAKPVAPLTTGSPRTSSRTTSHASAASSSRRRDPQAPLSSSAAAAGTAAVPLTVVPEDDPTWVPRNPGIRDGPWSRCVFQCGWYQKAFTTFPNGSCFFITVWTQRWSSRR